MKQNISEDILSREFEFPFIDKVTGKRVMVSASDSILATLRAHALNSNLTFDCDSVRPDYVPPVKKSFVDRLLRR
jgi:hypothetical protein